jgi:hypothetical protein
MLVLLAPLAVVVTVMLAWSDVGGLQFARNVGGILNYGYGTPMDWFMQPVPFDLNDELPFRDPWATHTTVLWVPLVVDLVLVYLLLLGGLWAARWAFRLVSRKPLA